MTERVTKSADGVDALVGPRILRGIAKLVEDRPALGGEIAEASGVAVEAVAAALRRSGRQGELARHAGAIGALLLDIPETCWEATDDDDPESDLYCGLLLNGVLHHFGAMRVELDEHGVQQAVGPHPEDLDAVTALYGPHLSFNTITVGGKGYVVHLVPGC